MQVFFSYMTGAKKCLKKDRERKRWEQIDYNYMTEESDAEGVIRQHKLTWRSDGNNIIFLSFVYVALNKSIRKLERRLPNRVGDGQFKFKERVPADPSTSLPQPNYVKWAVQSVAEDQAEATASCELNSSIRSRVILSNCVMYQSLGSENVDQCKCMHIGIVERACTAHEAHRLNHNESASPRRTAHAGYH